MTKRPLPSPELLHQLLLYNPDTGVLTWRLRPLGMFNGKSVAVQKANWRRWNEKYAGRPALIGMDGFGYYQGTIFARCVKAHHVAWAMSTGAWPSGILSHRDNDHGNNRFSNFVIRTREKSQRDARRSKANKSGVTGVSRYEALDKWQASIRLKGKSKHLGFFDTVEAAAEARRAAEIEHGFGPGHGEMRKPNAFIPKSMRGSVSSD